MTATRVTVTPDGMASESLLSAGGTKTSNDYQATGIEVRHQHGGFARMVTTPDELNGDDVVAYQGMSMKVQQARDLGVLGAIFGETGGDEGQPKANDQEATPKSDTGFPEYDQAADALNAALEQGSIGHEEAGVYDTNLAQLAMAGLSVDQAVETIQGLADGTLSEIDVDGDKRAMLRHVETSITQAAEKSALDELGPQAFGFLRTAAETNPQVDGLLRNYAISRAQGRSGSDSWADIYNYVASGLVDDN